MPRERAAARYLPLIARLFKAGYTPGAREVAFERDDIARVAGEIGIAVPKNVGDLVYSFKFRAILPESIRETAADGEEWRIVTSGRSRYKFVLGREFRIEPDEALAETKIPDATPEIISQWALSDEQALLAKVRYNRLIDIFTGVVCYSLQNHLRTSVKGIGQIETDEVYVGIDRRGAQYVFPVQAKAGRDRIALAQIEQDVALCAEKFPSLICRPIATKFMAGDLIALFAFEGTPEGVRKSSERHYRLVPRSEITDEDLRRYRERIEEQ
jgi:hypothetical protein